MYERLGFLPVSRWTLWSMRSIRLVSRRPPRRSSKPKVALTELPGLLRDDPALSEVRGRTRAVLAVPEPARALTIAGLAATSARHPILAAMPTTADAERLAHDLSTLLGPDAVETFPAWETLPFERVSPGVETMGRRLRTMWRLRDPERAPRVVVAVGPGPPAAARPPRRGHRAARHRARASGATATTSSPG